MHFILSHYTFTFSEPHQPGDIITPALARAMNWLRLASVRDSIRKRWNLLEAAAGGRHLLSEEELAEFQRVVDRIDQDFVLPQPPARRPIGALEAELDEVMREQVAMLRMATVSPETLATLAARTDLRAEARRRLITKLERSEADWRELVEGTAP